MKKNVLHKILVLSILLALVFATIPMTYAALSISLSSGNPSQGDTLKVTVSGGTPNGHAMIQFNGPSGVVWADQDNFTAGGGLTYALKIPSSWSSGAYKVWVRDHDGNVKSSKSFTIGYVPPPYTPPPFIIPNKFPVAKAGADQTLYAGRTVYFDGSGSYDPDGTIDSYIWIFGDGTTTTGVKVSHTYSSSGTYTASLVVIDNRAVSNSDKVNVTVKVLPLIPTAGVDEGVDAGKTNYVVDASAETDTTVKLNTTSQVTVYVLKYPSNPYPEAPLPENSLGTVVDIAVSDLDAVSWPIYVERHYTDADAADIKESKLAIYYYKAEAWHRCRETGAYEELNTAWADMYEDEVTGSPTIIAVLPTAATFTLSNLTTTPENVEPGDEVTISVDLTNVGDLRATTHSA